MPQLNNYQNSIKLKSITKQLVSDIKYVQQRAIITAIKHGIVFDLRNNCYYLIKRETNPKILEKFKLETISLKSVNFPSYNGLGFTGKAVFFKKFGNLDHRNGRIKLELKDEEKQIIFSSNAGKINVK